MPKFHMLALEKPAAFGDVGPAEMRAVVQRYVAWGRMMQKGGHIIHSERLQGGGTIFVRRRGSKTEAKPAGTKDVPGGFWLIKASDLETALELAGQSPHLDFGTLVVTPAD